MNDQPTARSGLLYPDKDSLLFVDFAPLSKDVRTSTCNLHRGKTILNCCGSRRTLGKVGDRLDVTAGIYYFENNLSYGEGR